MADQPLPPPPDKGKSKAKNEQDASQESSNPASMASRVLASATGLARDFMSSTNGNMATDLGSTLSSNGKAIPSASNTNSSALESLQSPQTRLPSAATAVRQGETFQEPEMHFNTEAEFQKFTQTGLYPSSLAYAQPYTTASQWTSEFNNSTTTPDRGAGIQKSTPVGLYPSPLAFAQPSTTASEWKDEFSTFIETPADGAEVSALLDDPSFVAMTDIYELDDPNAPDAADLFSTEALSPAELESLRDLKTNALAPPPTHGKVGAHSNINLLPDFSGASPEQREAWFRDWDNVLNGYTDQVWGDILPTVQEARKHLEEVQAGTSSLDNSAVARLRMILGHVDAIANTQ
ncbi:hypothetical protein BT63DRAFT_10275 [Microthyrium microscopicum]|uniref:Uncharacterized protein n=1 Tax=Microthyrium microscopicum TaxID=703497 RepID=A0A6A6USR2_9PEZI|nr:hypothetical protein BT63DRAFT_10275 [Microthyrium microscopicum]